eukprot:Awhi_evm1s633
MLSNRRSFNIIKYRKKKNKIDSESRPARRSVTFCKHNLERVELVARLADLQAENNDNIHDNSLQSDCSSNIVDFLPQKKSGIRQVTSLPILPTHSSTLFPLGIKNNDNDEEIFIDDDLLNEIHLEVRRGKSETHLEFRNRTKDEKYCAFDSHESEVHIDDDLLREIQGEFRGEKAEAKNYDRVEENCEIATDCYEPLQISQKNDDGLNVYDYQPQIDSEINSMKNCNFSENDLITNDEIFCDTTKCMVVLVTMM